MPLFTIIISGYQNEPYLPRCLVSISKQTFGDFEAICYVEESTDNSLAFCQAWAKRDPRFIVAAGPRSGSVSATHNFGIDHAGGEYLVFVDGDDWIASDMLEKLATKLNETGPLDILVFAAKKFPGEGVITNFREPDGNKPEQVFSGLEAMRRFYLKGKLWLYHTYAWLNIYRVSFLREYCLRQIEGKLLQDLEWYPRVFFFARKVSYLNECLYFYQENPNSVTHTLRQKGVFDFVCLFQSQLLFIKSHPIPTDIQALWSNRFLWTFFDRLFYYGGESIDFKDIKAILKIFFATRPEMVFWRCLLKAAWHRVLAMPFLWLASQGCCWPSKFYFSKIYPKLEWRFQHDKFPFHIR